MKKYCDISILFVLYDESVETIFKSLERIKTNTYIPQKKKVSSTLHISTNQYSVIYSNSYPV